MKKNDPFHSQDYKALLQKQILDTITYLFDTQQEFALECELTTVQFEPPLPQELMESFANKEQPNFMKKTIFFVISAYAYESASVDETYFSFESGFGEENIGANVTMPLLGIQQIFLESYPLIINHLPPHTSSIEEQENKLSKEQNTKESEIKNSMKSFLNHPENQKFLKKKT